jgi:hypothetical protein
MHGAGTVVRAFLAAGWLSWPDRAGCALARAVLVRPSFWTKRPLANASFHSLCIAAPLRICEGSLLAMASGMPRSISILIMVLAD